MNAVWTQEMIDQLVELWPTDLRARAIGLLIGVTKNAVVGKARRLGLPFKPFSTGPEKPTGGAVKQVKAIRARPRPVLPPSEPPIEGGMHIMDLGERHCREIIGHGEDGLARYCGATKAYRVDDWGYPQYTERGDILYAGAFCLCHARKNYRKVNDTASLANTA